MPKVRPLSPAQASKTFANRFARTGDRLRQIATNFGIRPLRVCLVWTKWSGAERGEGTEQEVRRIEILPTPKVSSLDSVSYSIFHSGTLPVGSIRVEQVTESLTLDTLSGKVVPKKGEPTVPEPYSFFYEVREDGRGDNPPQRWKYRLLGVPFRRAGKVDWTMLLEKISEDPRRDGRSAAGEGVGG